MVQTIKITNAERNLINDLLNLTGDEIYQKYGIKETRQLFIQPNLQMELKQILVGDFRRRISIHRGHIIP